MVSLLSLGVVAGYIGILIVCAKKTAIKIEADIYAVRNDIEKILRKLVDEKNNL